jgi:hypothetical protein
MPCACSRTTSGASRAGAFRTGRTSTSRSAMAVVSGARVGGSSSRRGGTADGGFGRCRRRDLPHGAGRRSSPAFRCRLATRAVARDI